VRQKLGENAERLETVRREGYRFNALLEPLPVDVVVEKARL
jgi:hypothetical protein